MIYIDMQERLWKAGIVLRGTALTGCVAEGLSFSERKYEMSDVSVNGSAVTGQAASPKAASPKAGVSKRKRLFLIFGFVLLLAGAGYGVWYALIGSKHVTTDNAYVGADTAQITPLVGGEVKDVKVSDSDMVRVGDILVVIDDRDARIAFVEAQANLDKVRRSYLQSVAQNTGLKAQLEASVAQEQSAVAQLQVAEANESKANIDLVRRQKLSAAGATTGDQLTDAQNAYATAVATVDVAKAAISQAQSSRAAAEAALAASNALLDNTTVDTSPDVQAAQAQFDQAKLNLERTVVRAPVDGVVAGRAVQLGQRVDPGTVVMKIVPIHALYVDANYKEGQLGKVKVGQEVTMTSDLYGDGVVYHGKVIGFAGGTGAAFALIPAQNATGNWIKVVQRLPVRVSLDPQELAAHPLRVGLSMTADIGLGDTHE